ncbi:MAG: hypothetical protein ACP6IU_13055 [Candidatus Asgardarchaeia archaeon]
MTESYGIYCPKCKVRYRKSVCYWEKEDDKDIFKCPNNHVLGIMQDGKWLKSPIWLYKKNYLMATHISLTINNVLELSFYIDHKKLHEHGYSADDLGNALRNIIIFGSSFKYPKKLKEG